MYGPGMENVEELQNSLDLLSSITGVSYDLQVPSDTTTSGMVSVTGKVTDGNEVDTKRLILTD
jgi:hypothetical protein